MKTKNKWLIFSLILMIISFFLFGFFFIKSGIINLENGSLNEEMILEVDIFNAKLNNILKIPLTERQETILNEVSMPKIQK